MGERWLFTTVVWGVHEVAFFATWAAFGSVWWVVAIAAVLGGTGYALGTRQWWRYYLRDPAEYARGASPRLLAALALAAGVGFAVLVVVGR